VESSTFFRGVGKVLSGSAHLWTTQVFIVCFRNKFLNFPLKTWTWFHHCRSSVSRLETTQIYFHCNSAESKKILSSPKHLHLYFAVLYKTGTPFQCLMKEYSIWAREVTSVDKSTGKKNIGVGHAFTYHLVVHIFRHIWDWPLNSITVEEIRLIFASLPSSGSSFTIFNKQFLTN